ncbi:hypothetical protein ACHAXS_005726, partial [Conticribra weissflogii]
TAFVSPSHGSSRGSSINRPVVSTVALRSHHRNPPSPPRHPWIVTRHLAENDNDREEITSADEEHQQQQQREVDEDDSTGNDTANTTTTTTTSAMEQEAAIVTEAINELITETETLRDIASASRANAEREQKEREDAQKAKKNIDVTAVQNQLLRIAASSDRGQYANSQEKDQVLQLVELLESTATESTPLETANANAAEATDILPPQLTGTWSLLYSNTQLFRSSPFFLAGRSTCRTPDQAKQYDWFCDMHRAALAISNIGNVRQIVKADGRLVNEFEVVVGAVPFLGEVLPRVRYSGGWPVTVDGAIVSSADVTPVVESEEDEEDEVPYRGRKAVAVWHLYMDTVQIKGSNIPLLRNILDNPNVRLKSRDLSKLLEQSIDSYRTPRPRLYTTFVDDGMRIVRDEDDHVFIYGKVSESQEESDYKGVMPDLGVGKLLEGFNDAITKFYL